jgi:hypothetical protein
MGRIDEEQTNSNELGKGYSWRALGEVRGIIGCQPREGSKEGNEFDEGSVGEAHKVGGFQERG